jgi:hypothetical protein
MHPLTTNITAPTRDVHRFGFESAGALEIVNEYSGLAVAPAHLYCLRRAQAGMSLGTKVSRWEANNESLRSPPVIGDLCDLPKA